MIGLRDWYEKFFLGEPFTREALVKSPKLHRFTVENWDDFFSMLWGRHDAYVSVHTLERQKERRFNRIFLDIDDADIYVAYMKMQAVTKKLKDAGLSYWVFYSGKKGFHVYLFTEDVELFNYRGAVLRWVNAMGLLELVDKQVIEPRRVARVPFTRHGATGMYMVPVSEDMSLKSIIKRALMGWGNWVSEPPTPTGLVEAEALKKFDIERIDEHRKEYVVEDVSKIFSSEEMFPPCIRRLVELARLGVNLSHDERVLLGTFLLHIMDVDEAMKYFEPLPDFSERETRYQLTYLKSRGMKVLSCKNIASLGLCPVAFRSCPFYPSINYFLRGRSSD